MMAGKDLDSVLRDLNERFAQPLPEFYKRRIIFWYDEDREFEDKLEDFHLDNAALVVLNGSNTYAVKKLLCHDDLTSNFLVYQPLSFQKDDDNWLINVQLYSEPFRADLISIWIDEMGLPSTAVIRKQVQHYRKFFNAKARREAVAKLKGKVSTAAQMHLAVMAALCGSGDIQPACILRGVLRAGLDLDANRVYQSFVNYGADAAFWVMAEQATGYNGGGEESLEHLAIHTLLTAASRTLPPDTLTGLDGFLSVPHQAYCYDFVSAWLHSEEKEQLYEVARRVEDGAHLPERFAKLDAEDLVDTECFPCINTCVLTALLTEIGNHIINVEVIQDVVEMRRTLAWYDDVSCYYEGILQAANMQQFFLKHSGGFHTVEPHKIWREYTGGYYQMDTFYRRFQLCFQRSLERSNPALDDLFKQAADTVEGLYSHWFLGELGQNWTDACAGDLAEYGRILEVPQQTDFYREKVKQNDSRVFVIVSDALRFEVAADLAEQLRRETQSTVKLTSCEALFPTITKFGMAALLPHKSLEIAEADNGTLHILADGVPTDSGYRDKVLRGTNKKSIALNYDELIAMKRAERSLMVKGKELVYIYHDKVDKASHSSDAAVFPACEDAVSEIKNLVRVIVNDFGGTKIYITADHGFLYTYRPLTEDGKADADGFIGHAVEYGRRYAITRKGAAPGYLLPVKFMEGSTEYEAFTPRENVRIKMKGGGLNFVHGGISLQEMVVPVIEYQFLRSSSKAYRYNREKIDTKPVVLNLLSASRKVHNMVFWLNFYQTEAVGGNRDAATYLLFFTDADGRQVSDTCKLIADKTSQNAPDRTFRCRFNLRPLKYSSQESYYLVIADESGRQETQREEFQIDIAFEADEFGFFE